MNMPTLACTALELMRKYEREFETVGDVAERLKYVQKRLTENGMDLSEIVELWKTQPGVLGNCAKSERLRVEGNKFYMKNQICEAKELYRYFLFEIVMQKRCNSIQVILLEIFWIIRYWSKCLV